MQIIRDFNGLAKARKALKQSGESLALVPTMGALHDGHLALVAAARKRADKVAASIFVNPLQFNDPADLERYPRQEEGDLAKLEATGVDLVWLPSAADLYPEGFATTIRVAGVSKRWEGEARPGHFDGVATVVAKLLIAVAPDVALFGEKDFQQLAVIRRLATDLGLGIEIGGVPTVRDADGLALSSRNAFLGVEDRQRALALPKALQLARDRIASGEPVGRVLAEAKQALVDAGFLRIDYFAMVDAGTLEPLDEPADNMRLIAAATIGTTRLIDNVTVE